MKKSNKKLNVNKESLRVLSKPELTVAVGGVDRTMETNACTALPSICVYCDSDDYPPPNGF